MKKLIDILLLLLSITTLAQNPKVKEISGKISHFSTPISNVNITIKGTSKGTKTDINGRYKINVDVGEILEYSHINFKNVAIVIEDITSIINLNMIKITNQLDETMILAKSSNTSRNLKLSEKPVITSRGILDPKRATYPISFVNGEDIRPIYPTLKEALFGKIPGIRLLTDSEGKLRVMVKSTIPISKPEFAIWDIDGQIFELEPPLDLNNIKSVHILKTLSATNKYGAIARGGIIVVRTQHGTFDESDFKRTKIASQYFNKDYYANDAQQTTLENLNTNIFANRLEKFSNKKEAFMYYKKHLKNELSSYVDHLAIAQKFVSYFNDLTLSTQIFKEQIENNNKNPEILKAIAFHLQTIGRTKEAIHAYERTFKLRPQYAQSYRDLANAYYENDQYKKSWRLYMSYLIQGYYANDEGIGNIMYNEMEYLYFNRQNQTQIKEKFIPKNKTIDDFRNDIRLVFEWNTSEAEFDLEFVSPDKRAYVFEHSFNADETLITNEKRVGYSSKEFMIDKLGDGNWLINLTYKGNKKSDPTYFKVTTYYNWGSSAQTKDILVFPLKNQRQKIQLFNFSKHLLEAFQ